MSRPRPLRSLLQELGKWQKDPKRVKATVTYPWLSPETDVWGNIWFHGPNSTLPLLDYLAQATGIMTAHGFLFKSGRWWSI